MSFQKSPRPLPDLVAHLRSIGLGGDPTIIQARLYDVGYYRLSPYWRFFREDPTQSAPLRAGTTIDDVWQLYTFDRELRLLALDAIERVEIAARARLVQAHALTCGAFGYAEAPYIPLGTADARGHYRRLLDDVAGELAEAVQNPHRPRVSEALRHFAVHYGGAHAHPPLWLAAEGFSFGDLVTLYRGSPRSVRADVAGTFQVPEPVFESWLRALQATRNVCAHHGRLWNRVAGVKPARPKKDARWSDRRLGPTDRVFYVLTILAYLTGKVCDGDGWAACVRDLLARHPGVPRPPMGVGDGWEAHPIWRARLGGPSGDAGGPS